MKEKKINKWKKSTNEEGVEKERTMRRVAWMKRWNEIKKGKKNKANKTELIKRKKQC